jgi:hypothetical protein
MFPLAAGLSLDVYLIARTVFEARALSIGFAATLFGALMALWLALPRHERNKSG